MTDEPNDLDTDRIIRETRFAQLEAEVARLRVLIGATAGASAMGFQEILERLEALEAAVFGNKVNGFDGAGEAVRPLAIIPSSTSA